ncbi:NAD(+)/NADH kinase [Butyrivibrio sp. YAB3001]|uniref:NAD(+)/NADH kinase n=1 Tax=Butyrivibrio sp. YAB3001 TaxID=1520812 RepID=UPI000B830F0E|nr:NAD(+)/NADH kinase [Butyrivibrio sp. YAB3001]
MDHFCIVTNRSKDKDLSMTTHIMEYLKMHGKQCVVADSISANSVKYDIARDYVSEIPKDSECCIVLGGDGTMLQAARSAAYMDIPLLGVNLGTLGYLAEVEKTGVDEALNRLIEGNFDTEDRMMLYGETGDKHDFALNDIVITRQSSFQTINFDIYINGLFLCNYHADGIVISTPTGSTGYSLSAGGPIVEPSANMILITPICPHTLNTRSMVLSDATRISLVIREGRDDSIQEVVAYFDGSGRIDLKTGDRVEIEKSNKTTKIIKLNRVSFLEVLGKKFDK